MRSRTQAAMRGVVSRTDGKAGARVGDQVVSHKAHLRKMTPRKSPGAFGRLEACAIPELRGLIFLMRASCEIAICSEDRTWPVRPGSAAAPIPGPNPIGAHLGGTAYKPRHPRNKSGDDEFFWPCLLS